MLATGLAFSGVVLRYGFSLSPEWLEEMTVVFLIWAAFIISSTLVEENRHVGATFLVDLLPHGIRRFATVVTSLLALAFSIIVAYWGINIVEIAFTSNERSTTSLRYPLWILYLSIPIGLSLISIRYCLRIYRLIFHYNPFDIEETHEKSRNT